MNPIKAAVVQAAPILFDTPKTIEKLSALARDAAGRGANLVVFPEAFVGAIRKAPISARGKYDLDVVGHYARPDVFRLSVDTRPKSAVTFETASPVAASVKARIIAVGGVALSSFQTVA